MRVTNETISQIQFYAGSKRSEDSNRRLLRTLLSDLDDINASLPDDKRLWLDYIDTHTAYSPERTDPCPDYYGYFRLRWKDTPFETVYVEMTIDELDSVMCVLYDFVEKLFPDEQN